MDELTMRSQNLVPAIEPGVRVEIGHPISVEAGQRWVWIADAIAVDAATSGDRYGRCFWSLNGEFTGAGWGTWYGASGMTDITSDAPMQIVSSVIEVPGPDHEVFDRNSSVGTEPHTIQPAVETLSMTAGTVLLRNLVAYRIA